MKLIILYGSPAVGKLTVVKALVEKTGYKLLHNHLIADLVVSIFAFGTAEYADLAERIKLIMIEEAAKKNVDLILTLVYGLETLSGENDELLVKKIIRAVERHGGTCHFIKLKCEKEEQIKRLGNESRKQFKKLTDPNILAEIDEQYQIDHKHIPSVTVIEIDITNLSPEKSAEQIIARLKL